MGYLPEQHVIAQVLRARESIRFVGPGLSAELAQVLASRWNELGPAAVEVVVDAAADLCRLGYCDCEALNILRKTAVQLGTTVHRQSGVRLCVLEIDGERIIFPPTPRLVEESKPNAASIILAPNQGDSLHEQILAPRALAPSPLEAAVVLTVAADLKDSPPQPFDLARQVRVLSTKFQFVEFSLQKAALSRRRVAVPPDLLGLGSDKATEELLRANFQLVGKEDDVSGEHLLKRRDEIEKTYLVNLAHFGKIILQGNREAFERAVLELRDEVKKFQYTASLKLDETIMKNCDEVVVRLLPIVKQKPPVRWLATLGGNPSDDQLRRRLEEDLQAAYKNASHYLGRIEIRLIFKDITVQMLRDDEFRKAAEKAKLYLNEMYEEYGAARERL
ncbi:MAG: hypothetical protein C0504_06245 [Candidatus Solibacter sp.]|nr:hypothetical protein [Candidatus Solibacter sp.]